MKLRWKPALVPIALTYFILSLADAMIWPYINLQMRSLGLTVDDITWVAGLTPIIAIIGTPLLGYVGDKLGYKLVFMICIVTSMIVPTSFNFLPVYREHQAKIALRNMFNTSSTFDKETVVWFGMYGKEGVNCRDSLENITFNKIKCDEQSYDVTPFQLNTKSILNMTRRKCDTLETFSCKYIFKEVASTESLSICSVMNDKGDGMAKEGSHSTTFWIYFVLRSIYVIIITGLFNIGDATGAIIAKRVNSSYSIILFCGNIGSAIPPWIVGPLVDNVHLGLSNFFDCITQTEIIPNEYTMPSFVADGLYILMAIVVLVFLDVAVEKTPKKMSVMQEFAWLKNPAVLSWYFFVLLYGINISAGENYFFVYTQEDLHASVTFMGYIKGIQTFSGICILAFGGPIMRRFGVANTYCFSFFMVSVRCIVWGLPFSPSLPYEFLAYGFLDMFKWLFMASSVVYTGIIAPERLTATALSLTSGLIWIVGNGIGAFISGAIVSPLGMRIMFIIFGVFFCSFCVIYWILYHMIIKKYEPDYSEEEKNETSNEENNGIDETTELKQQLN